eukprot:5445795-Amphidinium_carterae.1
MKCRTYGAASNGYVLPSGESFLPFSLHGAFGNLLAGALTLLHLLMHDMALKRLCGGSSRNHWSHVLSTVRDEVATALSHTLVRSEVAVLRASGPLIGTVGRLE